MIVRADLSKKGSSFRKLDRFYELFLIARLTAASGGRTLQTDNVNKIEWGKDGGIVFVCSVALLMVFSYSYILIGNRVVFTPL